MSVFVLYQNSLCVDDYCEKLAKICPKSSVLYSDGYSSLPNFPPLYSDKWLIFHKVQKKFQRTVKTVLQCEKVANIVFITPFKDSGVEAFLHDQKILFSVYDNTKVPIEVLEKYVQKELKIDYRLAKEVVKLSKRYEPLVVTNVTRLKTLSHGKLSSKSISLYILDSDTVSLSYLYKYLVWGEGEYCKVVSLVHKYQYAVDFLLDYVDKRLKEDILIFDFILKGELDRDNYINFSSQHRMPIDQVRRGLALFGKKSLEDLIAQKCFLKSMSKVSVIEFLYILRSGSSEC